MPAGISWPRYIGAVAGTMLSMFAGAQTVHIIYQPLKDLDERVEVEKHKMAAAQTLSHQPPPTSDYQ